MLQRTISSAHSVNGRHFHLELLRPPSLFFSLCKRKRQNVTFDIHSKLLANPPEFPGAR